MVVEDNRVATGSLVVCPPDRSPVLGSHLNIQAELDSQLTAQMDMLEELPFNTGSKNNTLSLEYRLWRTTERAYDGSLTLSVSENSKITG